MREASAKAATNVKNEEKVEAEDLIAEIDAKLEVEEVAEENVAPEAPIV